MDLYNFLSQLAPQKRNRYPYSKTKSSKDSSRLKMKHALELVGLSVAHWAHTARCSDQAIYDFINGVTQNSDRIESAFRKLIRRKAA